MKLYTGVISPNGKRVSASRRPRRGRRWRRRSSTSRRGSSARPTIWRRTRWARFPPSPRTTSRSGSRRPSCASSREPREAKSSRASRAPRPTRSAGCSSALSPPRPLPHDVGGRALHQGAPNEAEDLCAHGLGGAMARKPCRSSSSRSRAPRVPDRPLQRRRHRPRLFARARQARAPRPRSLLGDARLARPAQGAGELEERVGGLDFTDRQKNHPPVRVGQRRAHCWVGVGERNAWGLSGDGFGSARGDDRVRRRTNVRRRCRRRRGEARLGQAVRLELPVERRRSDPELVRGARLVAVVVRERGEDVLSSRRPRAGGPGRARAARACRAGPLRGGRSARPARSARPRRRARSRSRARARCRATGRRGARRPRPARAPGRRAERG